MKMAEYDSIHTGNQIDNFNNRISALESALAALNTNLTNNYVLESSFNTTIDDFNSTIDGINTTIGTLATKTQLNSLSMVPSNSYTSITRSISNNSSSWRSFMASYTAPTNGYMDVYFTGCSNTPAFYLSLSGGMQFRGNGNGGRDVGIMIPVRKG